MKRNISFILGIDRNYEEKEKSAKHICYLNKLEHKILHAQHGLFQTVFILYSRKSNDFIAA